MNAEVVGTLFVLNINASIEVARIVVDDLLNVKPSNRPREEDIQFL